ncbi:MAG: cytochrome b N-terminal domain-containing protein, partial [Melioribacteraceae bacterium]|nr:cytochrome b N-terminal domain-containing protein [Melioribacteraceae bacterium]
QFITGLLLRFYYEPFAGRAYDSIINLQSNVFFGQLIRNLHYWAAVFLIVITLLHLLRVFFSGAFHGKRQFNWVLGIILLLLVLFSNFTGYLLPWDQLSYWAVTVSTSMLDYFPLIGVLIKGLLIGGDEIGTSTLIIFYNLHTGILPILIIFIMAFHFWRVRKAGGVIIPQNDSEDEYISTVPNLVAKEFVVMLVLISFIFVLSILFDAPLLDKANPNFSPNPAKAPWYFMGIQELMLHFHPLFSAVLIPLILIVYLILIPYFSYDADGNGLWFHSDKGKKLVIQAAIVSSVLTIAYILIDEYVFRSANIFGVSPDLIFNGFLPFVIVFAGLFYYARYLRNSRKANKIETVQSLFVLVFVSFSIFTLIGIIFRGEGMNLTLF